MSEGTPTRRASFSEPLQLQGCELLLLNYPYGQESPGWISLFKFVTFFVENIQKPFFFGKIDWSMNSVRQRAGDS